MKATDRNKLIDRIKTLEGLTDDERSALLGLLNETKTYGLVWEDKPEEVEERLRTELPVLKEVKSRAIISDNADAPNHILIEGDNLEALTTLAYTHEGKIDVIYIDPPYNTGNKDFIYNDSYVDSEDSYRHSKWLSFMSRRLRIAKRLLSDRGVIFISIDDNEQANLKILCDEIFGQQNFIDIFSWNKTETPANLSMKTKKAVEYILCYCKQRNSEKFRGLVKSSTSNNGLMNQTNSEHILVFPKKLVDTKLPDGIYSKGIYGTKSYHIELLEDTEVKDGFFILPVVLKGKFKWGQKNLDSEIAKGTKVSIKTKAFSPSYEKAEYDPEVPWNLIDRSFGVETNEVAGTQLKEILGPNVFDFPKPVSLIKYLVNFISADYILDFFAGSGTTLHAVMQLNSEDSGKRKCILCTNNENGICENVTYERNKRVINGYTRPNGEAVEGLHNNNLRYYRTDFVGRRRTPQNMRRLMLLSSDMLCIKENLYTEHDEFGGMETMKNGFRYFSDGKKQMLIVYNEEAIYDIVDALEAMEVASPIIVYVFSPGNDAWNSEFESVSDKVRLTALPAAIYNAYKRVLPKPKNTLLTLENPTNDKVVTDNLFDFDEEGGEA
ncbi:site-specific DNA-methyltransferase [uncultured Duncaniella sp.]|uniref:site-specific DNA-methyltransferase n=1 Tax=uncultured Duncaniella sp. TaxID=2768039 RepID=UPI0025B6855C|nr:site-specific DNA-methyltransferase [uncultured Duncaniella sp.]